MLTKEGMAEHSEREGMVACLGKEGMSERLEGGDTPPTARLETLEKMYGKRAPITTVGSETLNKKRKRVIYI